MTGFPIRIPQLKRDPNHLTSPITKSDRFTIYISVGNITLRKAGWPDRFGEFQILFELQDGEVHVDVGCLAIVWVRVDRLHLDHFGTVVVGRQVMLSHLYKVIVSIILNCNQ